MDRKLHQAVSMEGATSRAKGTRTGHQPRGQCGSIAPNLMEDRTKTASAAASAVYTTYGGLAEMIKRFVTYPIFEDLTACQARTQHVMMG